MPSEALTETLMSRVETALKGIDGTTSYHYDVHGLVRRLNRAAPAVSHFPTIEIMQVETRAIDEFAEDTRNLYNVAFRFDVWGWVRSSSQPQIEASRIEQDIRTALEADVTFSALVSDTHWLRTRYFLSDNQNGVGIAQTEWESWLLVQRDDTSTGV